jgi:hypothetical protein
MGVSGQHHAPAALYPFRYPLDKRLGGPRVGLDAAARRKILCPCRGSKPDRPARSQTLYCLSYRGSDSNRIIIIIIFFIILLLLFCCIYYFVFILFIVPYL